MWQSSALIPMLARKERGNEREREKEGWKGHTSKQAHPQQHTSSNQASSNFGHLPIMPAD